MARVVVLVGAPGSGKSTVGALLGASGLRWRDWEPIILERWGSRESFVAAKAEALPLLHREIRSWIDEDGPAAVVESTGLSDAAFLDDLDATGSCFVARLDVSEPKRFGGWSAESPDVTSVTTSPRTQPCGGPSATSSSPSVGATS